MDIFPQFGVGFKARTYVFYAFHTYSTHSIFWGMPTYSKIFYCVLQRA